MHHHETEEANLIELYSQLPFNKLLGLRYVAHSQNQCTFELTNKPEFIGNTVKQSLHGGVIASAIDATGGIRALLNSLSKMHGLPQNEIKQRLFQSSTIDLRIDYLEPGRGPLFTLEAVTLRGGARLSVIRVEMHNTNGTLIAAGSATYLLG